MSLVNPFSSLLIIIFVSLALFCKPSHAFGAGNIPENSSLEGWVWKHGDIEDVLALVPASLITRYAFTKMDILRIYFGNWLRDYSQVIEIMPLTKIKEPTLRAIVSVLGFMTFGIATAEFDVKKERLGCYRPEEHIDNPRGYAVDAATKKYIGDSTLNALDPRLRRKVLDKELEIDLSTGMKNYIANEKINIETSAGYIRRKLKECIQCGRSGRKGNVADLHEAFIHLGALLHTLEDFSAHSNYIELALNCIGEKDIFTYVGDQCRIPIPTTNEMVSPLTTGTFGSLDIFQSIIGEVDDKAAMKNRGFITLLEKKLSGVSKDQFSQVAAQVASALKFLVKIIPGSETLSQDLEKTVQTVATAKEDPNKYNPGKIDITQGTNELWKAIEPIFEFHGKIQRFLIEYEKELEIPIISEAKKKIDEAKDELVYAALAVIIEPAVKEAREAIKHGKEIIEKVDRSNGTYINIFSDVSDASDPSHSILAKDHFSNYLNPIAGRVATATTNWTTQRVVECWDTDDEAVIEGKITSILEILHHPAFAQAAQPTEIQAIMLNIVEAWWMERSPSQLNTLREVLSKDGVERNGDGHLHGDNNAVLDASYFTGTKGFAVDWHGARPPLKEPEEKSLEDGVKKLLVDAAEALEQAEQQLDQGIKKAEDLINQGLDAADRALDDGVKEAERQVGSGIDRVTQEAGDLIDKGTAEVDKAAQEALKRAQEETDRLAEEGRKMAEEEARKLLERLPKVPSFPKIPTPWGL